MKKINLFIAITLVILFSSCGRILMVWDITSVVKWFFGIVLLALIIIWVRAQWSKLKEWFKK